MQIVQGVGAALGQQLGSEFSRSLRAEHLDANVFSRPKSFSGKADESATWSCPPESMVSRFGFGAELENAAISEPSDLQLRDMTPETRNRASVLYDVLLGVLRGESAIILKTVERTNGFQAWARLNTSTRGASPEDTLER